MAEIDCTLVLNILIVILLIWVAYKVVYKGRNDRDDSCTHKGSHRGHHHHKHRESRNTYPTDRIVLYFSRTTCGHCKRFNPTWDEFEQIAQGQIRTQKIICDDSSNRELCEWARDNLELNGVPHVVMIDPDTHQKIVFRGPRTVDALVQFVQSS